MTINCCADCGIEGGASLKTCKSCMQVKYCNAECQKSHWATHKKQCKLRAAELRDEALFKDPPSKEDCPICFLPMSKELLSCVSLPPATISPYQFTILRLQMRVWQIWIWMSIIPVVEKVFVEGVYIPSVSPETLASVHFAIPTEVAQQMKSTLKK